MRISGFDPGVRMFEKFLQVLLLACRHRNTSMPFSDSASTFSRISEWEPSGGPSGHYVVCLDCGRKFDYDWNKMQVIRTAR